MSMLRDQLRFGWINRDGKLSWVRGLRTIETVPARSCRHLPDLRIQLFEIGPFLT